MIVVTGAAGFIGANLVAALNRRGRRDILAVDSLDAPAKARNLFALDVADYMDKAEFLDAIRDGGGGGGDAPAPLSDIEAILHQGACADTMETDAGYMVANNFAYSKALYRFCARQKTPLIYASSASVYGGGAAFEEEPANESALNAYAWSKLQFDRFVRAQPAAAFQCAGLRYFNVYGARENHKSRMASVAWHFFRQYRQGGRVKLFAGSGGYADGEQRRDFVAVDDVVAVNLFLLDNPAVSGIFNVGSGRARTFNAVALAVVNACRRADGDAETTLAQAVGGGEISYIPMPEPLRGQYQNYTCADLRRLRAAGYDAEFADVEAGVGRYVEALLAGGDGDGGDGGDGGDSGDGGDHPPRHPRSPSPRHPRSPSSRHPRRLLSGGGDGENSDGGGAGGDSGGGA